MKKKVLIFACSCASLPVYAAPSFYGLINKEIRYVTQDKAANKKTFTGVRDVEGFESRIGAKGTHDLTNMKVDYLIELGLNSHRDNGQGERIRMRRAFGKFYGDYGALTIGQEWTPNSLRMMKLDPLLATGAQLLGLDSSDMQGSSATNTGMRIRYFQDLVSYATPIYSGTQLSVTLDQSNDRLNRDSDGKTEKGSTVMLTHDRKFSNGELNLHATYSMIEIENSGTGKDNDKNFWTLGARYGVEKVSASVAYTSEMAGKSATDKKIDRSHIMAGLSYDLNSNIVLAANWGLTTFDKEEMVNGLTKDVKQSQMGIGAIYKFNDNVKTRLIYKSQEIKGTEGAITGMGTKKSNKANSVITGITVVF